MIDELTSKKRLLRKPNSVNDSSYEPKLFLIKYLKPLISKYRQEIYLVFKKDIRISPEKTILDLGVSNNDTNYFEELYPFKSKITAAGLAAKNELLKVRFPNIKYIPITKKFPYPFKDNQYDVVVSMAVMEHVGGKKRQERYLKEVIRIGKEGMVTVPNRYFPLDFHTFLPFVHWLPDKLYRKIYLLLGFRFLAKEENLNFVSLRDLYRISSKLKNIKSWIIKKRVFGIVTNYVLFWSKPQV